MNRRIVQMVNERMRFDRYRRNSDTSSDGICSVGEVVGKKWKVLSSIGGGSFGEVYEAVHIFAGTLGALKIENSEEPTASLDIEILVYKAYRESRHCVRLYDFGSHKRYNFIVTRLLGMSLSQWRRCMPDRHFTFSTTIRCFLQMVQALEELHTVGFVHRDFKPSNLAPGTSKVDETILFVFDFGLCRRYVNERGEHLNERANVGFRGTVRYASINAHNNKDLSRRDDFISLFYGVVEMLVGKLPWTRLTEVHEVGKVKKSYNLKEWSKNVPEDLFPIYDYICNLSFKEKPNYRCMKEVINGIIVKNNVQMEALFDWQKAESDSDT